MGVFLTEVVPFANKSILFWLMAMILFIIIEMITVGLTAIWFAAGALAALLVASFGGEVTAQEIVFILVTAVLLWFTRPWARKFFNSKLQKTNADSVVGERIRITERVSNLEQTGRAMALGQDWSVRSEDEKEIIEQGTLVEVLRVSGVKLIVKRADEMEKER